MKKQKKSEPKRMFPTCWQGFRMGGGSQPVTNFPSIVAKFIVTTIYEIWMKIHHEFQKDTYIIIDGSTGWSGRMVGILGSYTDLRNRYRKDTGRELTICYLTTDPHEKIDYRFPLIVDDWFNQVEPDADRTFFKLRKGKFGSQTKEFFDFCKQKLTELGVEGGHLSLTSPPYFNREKYSKDKGQCCEMFKNYESYRDGFLRPSIQNIYDLLLPTGRFYFNIADLKDGKTVHPLQKNSTDFAVESGFKWVNTYKMLLKSSGKGCINKVMIKGKPRKHEPIFVFEKTTGTIPDNSISRNQSSLIPTEMKKVDFIEIKNIPSMNKEIFEYGNADVSSFLEYFQMRHNKYQDRFIVESRFLWQMFQNQKKIRTLIVHMEDGDDVYCYLKNVTIYPAIYLILMGRPASMNGNQENENRVLIEICKYNHVVGFEGIQEEIESVNREVFEVKQPYYEEYYIDTNERFSEYLNHGKWRGKYSINKVKNNSDFTFREFQCQDFEKNKKLVELWKSSKEKSKKGIQFETKSYIDILNSVANGKHLDNYLIYNLFYKKELIGCIMFLIIKVGDIRIAYQEHNINLSRFLESNSLLNLENNVSKNIGNIMFYVTTEDLIKKNVKYSYSQGIKFWGNSKSGEYKQRLNNKTIEFSKVFYRR